MPDISEYITTAKYAELHGLSQVAVKKRCARGAIPGAVKVGTAPHQVWLIPKDAEFVDNRVRTGAYIGAKRSRKKTPEENAK